GYRVVHYQRLKRKFTEEYSRTPEIIKSSGYTGISRALLELSRFDECAGYRYVPDKSVDLEWAGFAMRWRTNSHGHVSDQEYPIGKPANEYRIVVLGDSFAAGIMSSIRWPDVREHVLAP